MWTSEADVTRDLSQLDDICSNYENFPELITSSGRGKKSQTNSNPRKSPIRPGLLDRNGEPIDFDEEDSLLYEDAPTEYEAIHGRNNLKHPPKDPREIDASLQQHLRKSFGTVWANDSIENYIKAKAKETSPRKWHSTGSDSSSSLHAGRTSSLDGSTAPHKKSHRKRESTREECKKKDAKSSRGKKSENPTKIEVRSPVEKKKPVEVFEIPNPPWKRDRSSQNALISKLLEKRDFASSDEKLEIAAEEKLSLREENKKYVPPYRRNQKENEKEEKFTSDEDVIVEDDFEEMPQVSPNLKTPDLAAKLLPSDIKLSNDVTRENEWDISVFKKEFVGQFVSQVKEIEEKINDEEEEIEKNFGIRTVASIQTNKMELNNNDPEKNKKYENLAKKVLSNKNQPKKPSGNSIYDFNKIHTPYSSQGQSSQPVSYLFKKEIEKNEKKEFNFNARDFPSL